jgi:hypothetical protein
VELLVSAPISKMRMFKKNGYITHKNDNQFGNSLINQDRTLGWHKCITILIGPSLSSALKMQQTANNIRRITMRCYIQENAWLEAQITKRTNRTT